MGDFTECKTFKRDGDYRGCHKCDNVICPKYKVLDHYKLPMTTVNIPIPNVNPPKELNSFNRLDMVHHPAHYNYSKYEPKDVIRAWGLNFNLGNAVKYISRAGRKDDILQDLNKAKQYIEFEIEAIEEERKHSVVENKSGVDTNG